MRAWHFVTNRTFFSEIFALFTISLAVFTVFSSHLFGISTFPWDFIDSYFPLTFNWLAKFSLFHIPIWNPNASLGHPEHLSLQTGAFYPPLMLLDLVGITYSIYTATVFQLLHLVFAGYGAYVLAKRFNLNFKSALYVGVAYSLSASFFSNAQHPDIIRGSAFIPWLVYSLFLPTKWSFAAKSVAQVLIWFSFVTGSYPEHFYLNTCSLEE